MAEAKSNRAVFLDRDGVLIRDVDLLTEASQVQTLPGAAKALARLAAAGFRLIVVTNQTVVARGLASESDVDRINALISKLLADEGAPALDRFYFCPHHPMASMADYRMECECRKPRSGMLLRGAREFNVDLAASFLVGDRMTDIIAGAKAGCRTALVETGKHRAAPIHTSEPLDLSIKPGCVCADLAAAADWILDSK
jgi:D-glycero-D-manno-heptose 1,7-bisphosphate phosphatase